MRHTRVLTAEFLGTFVLIVFGVGVVAQTVLSKGVAGTTLSINVAWGLAVAAGALGLIAALYHTINHAVFKGLLFLGAVACLAAGCGSSSPIPGSRRPS